MLCLFTRSWSSTTCGLAPVNTDHLPTYNGGDIAFPSLIALRAVPKTEQVPASKQSAQKCGQFASWHSKRSHWLAEIIPGSYPRSLGARISHSDPRISSERPLHIVPDRDTVAWSTSTDTTKIHGNYHHGYQKEPSQNHVPELKQNKRVRVCVGRRTFKDGDPIPVCTWLDGSL